jgi:lipoprotein-anchoring transpeptidase ErfK/SrfK
MLLLYPLFIMTLLFCKSEPPTVVLHNSCSGYTELRKIPFPTERTKTLLDSLGLPDSLGEPDRSAAYQIDTRICVHPKDRRWLKALDSVFPQAEIVEQEERGVIHIWAGINALGFDSMPFSRRVLVLNGTGKAGLARDAAYRFSIRFGLFPLQPQTADADTFSKTVLYCNAKDVPLAKRLINYLRTGKVEVRTNLVDMILVLGADMFNPNPKVKRAPKRVSVVIKKSMFELFVYKDGTLIKSYQVAIGKNRGDKQKVGDNRTPEGDFTITSIEDSHDWEHDFADDTLGPIKGAYGPWFLRLSTLASETKSGNQWKGIAIHGTHDEASIGTKASEGCIRMRNEDVDSLKRIVRIGTPVRIEK